MTENEKLMLEVLERAYIEIHDWNARMEFPKESIEYDVGSTIAKIKGTTYDPKAMRRDRAKLKKQYGKPDSVKLKELREALKKFVAEHLGMISVEDLM